MTDEQNKKSQVFHDKKKELANEGILVLDHTYRKFDFQQFLRGGILLSKLLRLIFIKKISIIHCWCTPAGAIGYILSLLSGRPLVLDSFEPHAESMVETGTWNKNSLSFRLLFRLEKLQFKKAKKIICAAKGMMEYAKSRYNIGRKEEFVKPACVDLLKFNLSATPKVSIPAGKDDIVCVYAGKFGGIYLEQETFDFFATAGKIWGRRFKVLLLTSHTLSEIEHWCKASGFDRKSVIHQSISHEEVPRFLAAAQFAICPVKPVFTKKYCSPIKNGEYWAMGLPVVITRDISEDSEIILKENAGAVLSTLNTTEYAAAVEKIAAILEEPDHRTRIRQLAERYRNFAVAEKIYAEIYGGNSAGSDDKA